MTAAMSWPLQAAIHAALSNDAALTAMLGGPKIFDGPPHGDGAEAPRAPWVTLGPEEIAAWDDKSGVGGAHLLTLEVWSKQSGFGEAKRIAGAICDRLAAPPPSLARGRIVFLRFVGAEALREENARLRRMTLRFQVVVEDS